MIFVAYRKRILSEERETTAVAKGPRIELLSDREAIVEGCRGIMDYDPGYIRMNVGCGTVAFCGENLYAQVYTGETMVIRGTIRTAELGMREHR